MQESIVSSTGEAVYFPDPDGKWLVVNLWASWCSSCRDEITVLKSLQKMDSIQVVAYNIDNLPVADLNELRKHYDLHYSALTENPVHLFNLPAYPGVPVTYIMSPTGEWLQPLFGLQTESNILKVIDEKRNA